MSEMNQAQERLLDVHATALLALRMMVDFYSMQISLGAVEPEQVKRLWRFSAEQMGEGVPHLETRARALVEAYIAKLDQTLENGGG
jgi:hypothetical protein